MVPLGGLAENTTGVQVDIGKALDNGAAADSFQPVERYQRGAYPSWPLTCAASVPAARGGPARVPPPSTTSVWPVM